MESFFFFNSTQHFSYLIKGVEFCKENTVDLGSRYRLHPSMMVHPSSNDVNTYIYYSLILGPAVVLDGSSLQ